MRVFAAEFLSAGLVHLAWQQNKVARLNWGRLHNRSVPRNYIWGIRASREPFRAITNGKVVPLLTVQG